MEGDREGAAPSAATVLRNKNFLLYWLGQFVSLAGSWMQVLGQSLLILQLSNTAFALGAVNFASALPPALLLLYGGAVTDRFDKRKILIVTQVFFMAAAFALAALVRSGDTRFWHVLALAVVLGVAQAFDIPANQALVPDLVERDEIPPAVQLNQAIFHGSRLIGPPLAGWLIDRYGLYIAFVANGLSFLPVIGTLLVIRSLRRPDRPPRGGTLVQIGEGYAFMRRSPHLMALLGITALTTLLVFPTLAAQPFYVEHTLGQGADTLGVVMGFSGGGALLGATSLLFVPEDQRIPRIGLGMAGMVLGLLVMAGAPFAAGTAGRFPPTVAVACGGAALLGMSLSSALGLVATIIQQAAPDALRGRVMSLQSLVFMGLIPFASLLVTKVMDVVTVPVQMAISAAIYAVAAVFLLRRLTATDAAREPAGGE